MSTANLLVELFVEELPPKALKKLGEAFAASLFSELQRLNSLDEGANVTSFASPRRLAVHLTEVLSVAAQKPKKIKLMPASVAKDEAGEWTPAFQKKLASLGLDYLMKVASSVWDERISVESDGKQDVYFHTDVAAGLSLAINLQSALDVALAKLPIPKVMQYQLADGWTSVHFVTQRMAWWRCMGTRSCRSVRSACSPAASPPATASKRPRRPSP